jgi:phosphate ABC transporter phosphate-binding protein
MTGSLKNPTNTTTFVKSSRACGKPRRFSDLRRKASTGPEAPRWKSLLPNLSARWESLSGKAPGFFNYEVMFPMGQDAGRVEHFGSRSGFDRETLPDSRIFHKVFTGEWTPSAVLSSHLITVFKRLHPHRDALRMSVPTSAAELLALIERSGLLSPEILASVAAQQNPLSEQQQPDDVVRRLLDERLLTPFQAKQLQRGLFKGFFLTGKFKVLDFIGAGGMGKVYLCEHLILQRLVAVKVLQLASGEGKTDTQAVIGRFYREARAVAALDHPNVVRVFDVDRLGSSPFMVMEYVDGTNLHSLVANRGKLSPERAAAYIRMAAAGLEHAHQAGLIHRDVKPSNILLERTGMVKLLDLGLARFAQDPSKNEGITTRLDQNAMIGTVDFMAPEQAVDSSKVDIRSDIYSLGCTFYFLLTGRVPFPERGLPQKIHAHQSLAPEPVSEICPRLPADLVAIIERMMEKSPESRFQTPGEVVEALAGWITTPIPPPSAEEMPATPASYYRLGLSRGVSPSADQLHVPISPSGIETFSISDAGTETPPTVVPPSPSFVLASSVRAAPPSQVARARSPSGRKQLQIVLVAALMLTGATAFAVWMAKKPAVSAESGDSAASPSKSGPATPLPAPARFAGVILRGGGSTFVNTPMTRWASVYEQVHKVRIDYQPVGSSKGTQGVIDGVYQFGCSDAALSDQQLAAARKIGGEMIHIPLVMGAVVATYNLPDVDQQLRFTGPVLADIYLGKITRWNAEPVRILNPGVPLPDMPITVVHRADGSGTTFIWTDYLSKASAEWKQKIGASTTIVNWPAGLAGPHNNGVASLVSRNIGAIGYVELTYALENNLRFAQIKNHDGRYVQPSLDGVIAAATASLQTIPDDLRYTLTDAPGDNSYPLAGTAWAILYVDQTRNKSGSELVAFLHWATHDGQAYVRELQFAPLPPELVKRSDDKLAGVRLAPAAVSPGSGVRSDKNPAGDRALAGPWWLAITL